MTFINPNFYFPSNGFRVRWTLIAFVIINICLFAYLIYKNSAKKAVKISFNTQKMILHFLLYLSTIPVYYFRNVIGDNGTSVLFKTAYLLNSIESIVVIVLVVFFFYGLSYKNSHTFFGFYCKVLAVLEITYIYSCYLTSQTSLDFLLNWIGVVLLGVAYVALNTIRIEPAQMLVSHTNPHDAIKSYNTLFSARKWQANELVNIIESDLSESGYSICITGKWGMGKTSLVNGALDKLSSNKKVKTYEIRINAMELDDNVTLIKYFFKRIEDILSSGNIYVGIASEYKDLIVSISGSIVNEGASNFISKKLSEGSTDYRSNLGRLSDLLSNNLTGSRIAIIIDDIDRCSEEKAKSFLFLMKEIATMNRCIIIFLVDIEKLNYIFEHDAIFLDKFFNHTISLTTVQADEISHGFELIYPESEEMHSQIIQMLKRFDEDIARAKTESLLYIKNADDREKYKEAMINSIIENKQYFENELSNPRNMGKAFEYYKMLSQQISQQRISCSSEQTSTVESFLSKIEHEKQLSLLSIVYGLYNSEFIQLQQNGIYHYVVDLGQRLRSAESPQDKTHRVYSIIDGEWHSIMDEYLIQEKLRFINCVLTEINELSNISNGYTSLEEKYISTMREGVLPDDIALSDFIEMVYHATNGNVSDRKVLIEKTFELFSVELADNSVDAAFDMLVSSGLSNYYTSDTPILELFLHRFCTNSKFLERSERVTKAFNSFAQTYLWRGCNVFSRYLMPLSSPEKVSIEVWNNASERVLLQDSCEKMITAYCGICDSYLEFGIETSNAFAYLTAIIKKADGEYYDVLKMSEMPDIVQARKDAYAQLAEVACLFKIEEFIKKNSSIVEPRTVDFRDLSIDTLSSTIESLHKESCNGIQLDRQSYVQTLLQFICENECRLTATELKMLNDIVTSFYLDHGRGTYYWRQLLIYIKKEKMTT